MRRRPWNGLGWSGAPGKGTPKEVISPNYIENSEEVYLLDYVRNNYIENNC